MAVVEADADGVMADEFGVERGDRGVAGGGSGEDGEGVAGHFVAELAHVGGGGHLAEVGDGVERAGAVGPLDGEPAGLLEVDAAWGCG